MSGISTNQPRADISNLTGVTPDGVLMVNASGVVTELTLGAANSVLRSAGTGVSADWLAVGAANGLATLDGSGHIPTGQLPAISITDVFVVGSEAAMLALVAEKGDVAVRTDLNQSYILSTNSPGTLADWIAITATATVTSVGLALPAEFNVTVTPITSSGSLTAVWANESANLVFAGPTTGSAATPGFRALVNADIPTALSIATLQLSGQFTSTIVTGTAPLVVASTTVVSNLNSSLLLGSTWASPAAIGTGTPAAGTFTDVTATSMTPGGVAFYGTGGILAYSASLLFDSSTQVLSFGDGTASPAIHINGVSGGVRDITGYTAGVARWVLRLGDGTAESGANAGTELALISRNDDGTQNDVVLSASRVSTGPLTTVRILKTTNNTASTSTSTGAIVATGGIGAGGSVTIGGDYAGAGRYKSSATTITTAMGTGQVGFWRSGGTIGTAGDMVLQTDLAIAGAGFVFRTGQTTPVSVCKIDGVTGITVTVDDSATAANTTLLTLNHTSTGTVAANFGSVITYNLEDDGGTNRFAGDVGFAWADPATATRTSKYILALTVNAVRTAIASWQSALYTQVCTDSATSSATVAHTIQHLTSGTAAIGFGTTLQFQGPDDGATTRVMSQMSTTWTDAASATRSSKTAFDIIANATTISALILAPTIATFQCQDSATNTATVVANFTHVTTGTAATNFGTSIQISGYDDGNTQRSMTTLTSQWTTATSATRSSKFVISVQVSATVTAALTVASNAITCASGFPVTISDTTASTTSGTGALIVSGGVGIAGAVTTGSTISATGNILTSGGRLISQSSLTTAAGTGNVAIWRSGGTIGTAGDMVLQTDLGVATGAFVFRSGLTTPVTVATISVNGTLSCLTATFTTPLAVTSGGVGSRQSLVDAATIATDASLGCVFDVTLGGDRTLGTPTNPTDGQRVTWRIKQDGTGNRLLSFSAAFRFGTDVTTPTLSTAAGATDVLGAIYDATSTTWWVVAFASGY